MSLDQLLVLVKEFKRRRGPMMEGLRSRGKATISACQNISRSFSGSFAGWHGRIYYGEFKQPPLNRRFSVEWGGIHGLPEGWRERTPEEVKAEVERLVEKKGVIETLEVDSKRVRTESEELRNELAVELSRFPFDGDTKKEHDLLVKLEEYRFGETAAVFAKANTPKTLMSRDTDALMEGICLPSHVYYEAIAREAESVVDAADDFLKLAERLIRQLAMRGTRSVKPSKVVGQGLNLSTLHPAIYGKCNSLFEKAEYSEAVEKSFKVVRDRLRTLTGYETGSDAFGKTKLHIRGAAAPNVDRDFNEAIKFLTMAIDRFRNEKSHTSDAKRGKVRKCVNERGRCNLRFASRTSGAINARTEGDTACEEEEHRVGGGVKGRMGDARSLRAAGSAAALAAGAGRRSG